MKPQAYILAAALLLAPVSAAAQPAACTADLNQVAARIEALSKKLPTPSKVGIPATQSWRTVTLNRMATAWENPQAASLTPADHAPSGAEGTVAEPAAKPAKSGASTNPAILLGRARSSWQTALARHARGNEQGCETEIADARRQLKSIEG